MIKIRLKISTNYVKIPINIAAVLQFIFKASQHNIIINLRAT